MRRSSTIHPHAADTTPGGDCVFAPPEGFTGDARAYAHWLLGQLADLQARNDFSVYQSFDMRVGNKPIEFRGPYAEQARRALRAPAAQKAMEQADALALKHARERAEALAQLERQREAKARARMHDDPFGDELFASHGAQAR